MENIPSPFLHLGLAPRCHLWSEGMPSTTDRKTFVLTLRLWIKIASGSAQRYLNDGGVWRMTEEDLTELDFV
jgi:hypothetical protein